MTPRELAEEAISRFNKKITNEIFALIQNDRELMYEYLRIIERDGLDTTNQTIGKMVKAKYGLTNADREEDPSCTLIQSHQKFK
ncbi:hypothetical protein [Desulfoluna spongiiphila]|uniref:hypothetical protein n=1 Tax=Desulfoluna spongiiphila TaxID=419481 RepID=UPI00125F6924|nr:hypothetical protein [Desulfoluna spongiiphila]